MTMATPAGRPSYSGWLDEIGAQGRTDEFGLVASAWLAAKANGRPKLTAVKSVNAWLSEHVPPGLQNLQAVLHKLGEAYHSAQGLPDQPMAAQPQTLPGMAGPPPAVFQPPTPPGAMAAHMAAAAHQQPAPPAVQQPDQPPVAFDPGRGAGDPAQVPEHPWQVIMLALGRIEAWMQHLAPLAQLAAEAGAVEAALDASQLAQPSEAQQRALEIAQQEGWTAGPAIPQPEQVQAAPVDFYGGHVVPQPDFAAMGEASDGTEDAE